MAEKDVTAVEEKRLRASFNLARLAVVYCYRAVVFGYFKRYGP